MFMPVRLTTAEARLEYGGVVIILKKTCKFTTKIWNTQGFGQ